MVSMKNPHAVALGRLGGSVKSEAKARASRENGRLGGDPRHLTEVPKLIDPGKMSPEQAAKVYLDLKKDRRKKSLGKVYDGAELVRSGQKFAVMDHNLKQVTYYMVYQERKVKNFKAVYQSMVWRNKSASTEFIPREVFWNYLFPIYGKVTTDRIQTDLGKGFWQNIIIDAAEKRHLLVYFIDLNSGDIEPIKNQADLSHVEEIVWGKTEANKGRLILISADKLGIVSDRQDRFGPIEL